MRFRLIRHVCSRADSIREGDQCKLRKTLSTRGGTIAVSAVAAALAAVILVAYLHRYRDSVRNSGVPVTVLVAKGLIEKGTSGDIIASQDLYR